MRYMYSYCKTLTTRCLRARYFALSSNASKKEKFINEIKLLGRVGNEPKVYGSDKQVVVFHLATNHYRDAEDSEPLTNWHTVSVFRPALREYVLKYVKRGARLYCEGRMECHSIERDGTYFKRVNIALQEVVIMAYSNVKTDQTKDDKLNINYV